MDYRSVIRTGLLITCLLGSVGFLAGCASQERKKTVIVEEQHEGEVVEERPGEMIVE
jgi:hypothetical protein